MMPPGSDRKEGFTLIGVLVFCLILIPVCASLAQASRDFAHGVRDDIDVAKREFLAGGIAEAVAARLGSDKKLLDQLDDGWLTCSLSGTFVAISARDHDGKIDLNNAASELLIAGFEAMGLDHEKAGLLQQFVEASRSNGAIPREISTLIAKVSLKHAPFEHVDELQDVLSGLEIPMADLDRMFTVDTGVANVEEATAAPELRAKLSTFSSRGIVFEDNGTSDLTDVLVQVKAAADGKGVALSKTYRKISPIGDVIEIRTRRFRPEGPLLSESRQLDCIRLLGLQGET